MYFMFSLYFQSIVDTEVSNSNNPPCHESTPCLVFQASMCDINNLAIRKSPSFGTASLPYHQCNSCILVSWPTYHKGSYFVLNRYQHKKKWSTHCQWMVATNQNQHVYEDPATTGKLFAFGVCLALESKL